MEPLSAIAHDGELMAFKHRGFWKAMDHLRDKIQLDELASSGKSSLENLDFIMFQIFIKIKLY